VVKTLTSVFIGLSLAIALQQVLERAAIEDYYVLNCPVLVALTSIGVGLWWSGYKRPRPLCWWEAVDRDFQAYLCKGDDTPIFPDLIEPLEQWRDACKKLRDGVREYSDGDTEAPAQFPPPHEQLLDQDWIAALPEWSMTKAMQDDIHRYRMN